MKRMLIAAIALALIAAPSAWAKIPPPPPKTDEQKAADAAKKKAQDDKDKADVTSAEDKAVKNFQDNQRKKGKPIPKPVPVVAKSTPPTGGSAAPEGNTMKAAQKAKDAAKK
ncbi:MAG TPA: hypothetical protein VH040_08515 [Usitatibacter sp.]|jgi:hypothetical protein|nr:hypothetical protein [Usitatibacter sp.]